MNGEMKIKVCGMRQGQNIKALGKLKPDYMGLIFYPKSSRFVNNDKAVSILKAIPAKTEKVGVFVNEHLLQIIETCNLFNIRTIQLHGDENPKYCEDLKSLGFTIIKAFGISEHFNFEILEKYKACSDFFLFDTQSKNYGGTGIKFDWTVLQKYDNDKPIFLSGGIGPEDTESVLSIKDLNLHALDLNSKFELEPGIKDITRLEIFLQKIRPL